MLSTGFVAPVQAQVQPRLPDYNPLLVSLLLLLCGWLAYRLLRSRLEILNIQAIDFHALADNAYDGIFIVQNEKLVYANQRAADILACDNEQLLELTLRDIIHPDEAEHIVEIHQRRIRGEDVPKQYEATFINRHNNKVPVELTATVTSWQGKPAVLIIIRDITERKLIEKTLMDSEKRYRSLVENSPDAILIIDFESNAIIEANEQTEQLFKLDKQHLFSIAPEELSASSPNSTQKPFAHYLERALHGLPLIFERAFCDGTGRIFSCEVRLSRMPFPNRKLVRASIIDITQRKLFQSALAKSEERLASFFQASFEALFFHDQGIVLDVNDMAEKVFGHSKQDMIGRHVLEFVAPESIEQAKQNMRQGIEGPYELIALRKDSASFPVRVQAKTLHQDHKAQRIVSVTDISNLKQTNEKLLNSERDLQNIINNMLDTFYRTDKEGVLTMVSPSVEKLLGYTVKELLGSNITSLYANAHDRQLFLEALTANNGELHHYEAPLRHKNGELCWVSTNARFRYDPQGDIVGVEGITRDITHQRHHKTSLSQEKEALETEISRRTQQLERLRQELAASEQNFRTLIDNCTDKLFVYDLQGRIIDTNQRACRQLGYRRDELLKLKISDIDAGPVPPDLKHIVKTLQHHPSLQLETRYRHKDGRGFAVRLTLGLLRRDNTSLILALARDISQAQSRATEAASSAVGQATNELS